MITLAEKAVAEEKSREASREKQAEQVGRAEEGRRLRDHGEAFQQSHDATSKTSFSSWRHLHSAARSAASRLRSGGRGGLDGLPLPAWVRLTGCCGERDEGDEWCIPTTDAISTRFVPLITVTVL